MPKTIPLVLCLTFLTAPEVRGQEKPPAKVWQSCVACHQPPDLRFATDQAWLDQVHRTG
jgi:hypothetical protein